MISNGDRGGAVVKPDSSLPAILRDWTHTATAEELHALHDRVEHWHASPGRTVALGVLESLIRQREGGE